MLLEQAKDAFDKWEEKYQLADSYKRKLKEICDQYRDQWEIQKGDIVEIIPGTRVDSVLMEKQVIIPFTFGEVVFTKCEYNPYTQQFKRGAYVSDGKGVTKFVGFGSSYYCDESVLTKVVDEK